MTQIMDELLSRARRCYEQGRADEAEQLCQTVLQHDPNNAHAHRHLAACLADRQRCDQAVHHYQRFIELEPANLDGYYHLADLLQQQGRYDQAIDVYKRILVLEPGLMNVCGVLAHTLLVQGRYAEAVPYYTRVIDNTSAPAETFNNLGIACMRLGRFSEAVTRCTRAVHMAPERAEFHSNLGNALQYAGKPEAALVHCRQAVALQPGWPAAYYNQASVHRDLHQIPAAIDCLKTALQLHPDFTEARWTLAHLYLLNGELTRGWRTYDWWRCDLKAAPVNTGRGLCPWDGSAFPGQRLLVGWERGYGDNFQFLRYLPQVKSLGGTVIMEAPAEVSALIKTVPGVDAWVPVGPACGSAPPFDLYTPLLGLGGLLGMTMDTIPAHVPYMQADPGRTAQWRQRIDASDYAVGIVWSGDPGNGNNAGRSCTLRDFADTAAILACLDRVISVDTAVLHLAGALGRPVWGLMCHTPDWRWLLDREDCPWYPTMRLFRQERPGRWQDVFQRVRTCLQQALEYGSNQP